MLLKMTFGSRLKNLLNERQISQKQLAQDLNVAISTLNGYVQDYREPDFKTLAAIAKYFSVSADYLIGLSEFVKDSDYNLLKSGESELIRLFRMINNEQQELLTEQTKLYIRHNNKKASSSNTTLKNSIV